MAFLSACINSRGVRQRGVTSTGFYLVFADGLLVELEASGLGATLCSVRSGNLEQHCAL